MSPNLDIYHDHLTMKSDIQLVHKVNKLYNLS